MPKFIIPGMYKHFELNCALLFLMQDHPEYFYPDAEICATYGNFHFCILDGGRAWPVNKYNYTPREQMEHIISTYNQKFNIPVRYVFTNKVLEPHHYFDHFSNVMLEIGNNYPNEVVLSDVGLREYIKQNYENYTFISSTTKCITNVEALREELNDPNYKMICIDYNLNHAFKFLDNLSEMEKNKVEFLTNAICPPGCPIRKEHYKGNSIFSLNYGKQYALTNCGIKNSILDPEVVAFKNTITQEEVYNVYTPKNFQYFKLEGRTLPAITQSLIYANYLALPEYRSLVVETLMSNI